MYIYMFVYVYIYICKSIWLYNNEDWLLWLWRLSLKICNWQVGHPREFMVSFQCKTEGIRNRRVNGKSSSLSLRLKAGEDWCPSCEAVRQRGKSSFPKPFCSIRAFSGWIRSNHIGEHNLLYSVYWFKH